MYLGGIFKLQSPTTYAIKPTDRGKDWNAKPQHLYTIKDFNVPKTSNECPEPSLDDENRLYKFDEVYSVDQTFHIQPVLRKCKIVKI